MSDRLQQLELLEFAVLATAEVQPLSVLELTQLGSPAAQVYADLCFLQGHPAFSGLSASVHLEDGGGKRVTMSGEFSFIVRTAAEHLRARIEATEAKERARNLGVSL